MTIQTNMYLFLTMLTHEIQLIFGNHDLIRILHLGDGCIQFTTAEIQLTFVIQLALQNRQRQGATVYTVLHTDFIQDRTEFIQSRTEMRMY